MSKWADYGISAVRFNQARTHIDRVLVHKDNGDTFDPANDYARADIVDAIKAGTTFVTIIKDSDGKWRKGEKVYIIKIHGIEFIKTVNDGITADNLDNLPEF